MRLGFVGVGTIASAMVDGLCASGLNTPILLSPRNAGAAAALAARHANVRIAGTNQAVLDGSDLVMLAVRPQIVDQVLPLLRFRPDHHVLSLIATVPLDRLRTASAPAGTVTRAVPLPSVAMRQGPTAIFPADERVQALFDRMGKAIVLEKEAEFDLFTAATATMASYFAFADTIVRWMGQEGVAAAKARAFVEQMLAGLVSTGPGRDFAELADEHQTRGGLNEQVVRHVAPNGVFADLTAALDGVLARLRAARPADPDNREKTI